MTTIVPQHMLALERGDRIRRDRAVLKRQVNTGDVTAASVILDPPECALSMKLGVLLRAQHGWGETRTRRLLVVAQTREYLTLGALTPRQRRVLADLLTWGTA